MRHLRWCLVLALLLLTLIPTALADGDDGDDDDEQKILAMEGEDLGNIALYLLIATLMIVLPLS